MSNKKGKPKRKECLYSIELLAVENEKNRLKIGKKNTDNINKNLSV